MGTQVSRTLGAITRLDHATARAAFDAFVGENGLDLDINAVQLANVWANQGTVDGAQAALAMFATTDQAGNVAEAIMTAHHNLH